MANKNTSVLHPALKGRVIFNNITNLYEIKEKGITYGMPFTEFQYFKQYFGKSGTMINDNSIEIWYSSLDRTSKKSITRSGKVQGENDGFYPD